MPAALLPILAAVWSFIRAHWKPVLAVTLLLAAFIGGRCSVHRPKPGKAAQVLVKDTATEKQLAQARQELAQLRTENETLKRSSHEVRTVVTHADGTKIETETRDTDTVREAQKVTDTHEDTQQQVATQVTEQHEEKKTVTPAPPVWFAGVDLGVPMQLKAPYVGTPFVVLHVDRALPKPRWLPFTASVGLWGSVDVKGHNLTVGPSIGVSFP